MTNSCFNVFETDPFYLKDCLKDKVLKGQAQTKPLIDLSRGEPINTPDILSDRVFMFFWELSLNVNEKFGDENLQNAKDKLVLNEYEHLLQSGRYSAYRVRIEKNIQELADLNSEFTKSDILRIIISESRGEDYLTIEGSKIIREVIAKKYAEFLKIDDDNLNSKNITLTIGGSEGIGALFEMLDFSDFITAGSTVAITVPVYSPYKYIIEKGGFGVYSIMGEKADDFVPTDDELDKFEASIIEEKIKLLIMVNPGNPLGIVYPEATLKRMAKIAEKYDVLILEDIVYSNFLHRDEFRTIYNYAPQNTVIIGSSSKLYQSTGTRFGFVLISDSFNEKFTSLLMNHYELRKYLKDSNDVVDFNTAFSRAKGPDPWGTFYLTHHVPGPSQWISLFRYLNGHQDAEEFKNELRKRWELLFDIFEIPKIDMKVTPIVPYYALIDMKDLFDIHNKEVYNEIIKTDMDPFPFIEAIFLKAHVAIIPAAPFFLNEAENHGWFVRFSVANQKIEQVRAAAERIVQLVKEWK